MKYKKHADLLSDLYYEKGMVKDKVEHFVSEKLKKLERSSSQEDYHKLIERLISECLTARKNPEPINVLDIGGGTGELGYLFNKLGANCEIVEIYEKELEIAKSLYRDNGLDPMKCHRHLPEKRFDLVTMFSVLEHLSDEIFDKLLCTLYAQECRNIFIIVPNKYKIIDDHTNLPFLGLFNRKFVHLLLNLINKRYELSENGEWDVWYRSIEKIEKLARKNGYILKMTNEDDIFPPLTISPKLTNNKGKYVLLRYFKNIYGIFVSMLAGERNTYPYLNFYLIKK